MIDREREVLLGVVEARQACREDPECPRYRPGRPLRMSDRVSVREREQQLVEDRAALPVAVSCRQRCKQAQREDPLVVTRQRGEAIGGQRLVEKPGCSFVAQLSVEVCELAAKECVPGDLSG